MYPCISEYLTDDPYVLKKILRLPNNNNTVQTREKTDLPKLKEIFTFLYNSAKPKAMK
jgi:hypothetical protein